MISRTSIVGKYPTKVLGEVAEFLDHMRRPVKEADRHPGPYPYFGANGQQGTIDGYIFDEPLVLLAEDGGFFNDPNRGIAYRISGKTWVNNHAHVLRPRPDVDLGYLCRVLESYDVTPFITGTTRAKLTKTGASEIPIPLPPLPEQRRIADILDRAEALRAKRRAAIEEASKLTEAIFLDMFGSYSSNPRGWKKGTLGDVAEFVGGGTPSRARPEFFEGSICWATSKDMKGEFLDDTQEHITPQAIEESATKLVPAGTVLIVVKSKILAHSLPVAIARVPTCFGQDIKGIRVSKRCDATYVASELRVEKWGLLERARGINTEGLTLDHLREFPLLLPPLDVQQDFARRAAAVERLTTLYRTSLGELNALYGSLQHRAFRGELSSESLRVS